MSPLACEEELKASKQNVGVEDAARFFLELTTSYGRSSKNKVIQSCLRSTLKCRSLQVNLQRRALPASFDLQIDSNLRLSIAMYALQLSIFSLGANWREKISLSFMTNEESFPPTGIVSVDRNEGIEFISFRLTGDCENKVLTN